MRKTSLVLLAVVSAIVILINLSTVSMAAYTNRTLIQIPSVNPAGTIYANYPWYKVENPVSNSWTDSTGTYSVTWQITGGNKLSFTASPGIVAVLIKGGPDSYLYEYNPATTSESNLVAPPNPGQNEEPNISHFFFIWGGISTKMYTDSNILIPDDSRLSLGAELYDTAIVIPSTNSGSMNFTLYKDNTPIFNSPNRPLVNGVATSLTYTTETIGSYHWQAVYSGNSNYPTCSANPEPFSIESSSGDPLPELPAVALLGLGLAGVGAFIAIQRRRGTVSAG
jgi:hypothetical protein